MAGQELVNSKSCANLLFMRLVTTSLPVDSLAFTCFDQQAPQQATVT